MLTLLRRAVLFESSRSHPQQLLTVFRAERSLLVDIPTGWEPRTEQQPTGLIACGAVRRRLVRAPSIVQTKRKTSTQRVLVFLGAMEGTRTPGLLIRSQSLYPAELPTHTFRSEHDVFYHAESGLSTGFLNFFDSFLNRASFRTFFLYHINGPISPPVRGAGRSLRRWAWRQGRPGRSRAGPGRAGCPRGPWRQ